MTSVALPRKFSSMRFTPCHALVVHELIGTRRPLMTNCLFWHRTCATAGSQYIAHRTSHRYFLMRASRRTHSPVKILVTGGECRGKRQRYHQRSTCPEVLNHLFCYAIHLGNVIEVHEAMHMELLKWSYAYPRLIPHIGLGHFLLCGSSFDGGLSQRTPICQP